MRYYPLLLVGGLAVLGCSDDDGDDRSEVPGELGNGVFTYTCVTDGDAACERPGTASVFPKQIAADATFDLVFESHDSFDTSRVRIEPAASGIVEPRDDAFRAVAPGVVALLARRTSDSRILDLVHLTVADVEGLRLEQSGRSPRVVWETGEQQTLQAVPLDEHGSRLAGSREYTWKSGDTRIIRLERANPSGIMEFLPLAEGTVALSATDGTRVAQLDVTVEGAALAPDGGDGGQPSDGGAKDGAAPTEGGAPGDGGPDGGDASSGARDAGGDASGEGGAS